MTSPPITRRPASPPGIFATIALILVLLTGSGQALGQTRELVLGIEPEHNIFTQMTKYGYLADYLAKKSGIPIRLTIMSRYGEVLQRFKALHLDGAFLNAYTATLAIDELGMAPVARPVNLAGATVAHGLIFTRRDSGIRRIVGMRGKSIALVDPANYEGYLFPIAWLKQHGVTDIDTFFGRRFFTGSHASTISAVLDGRADLGAAMDVVYKRQIAKDPGIARELVILEESPPTPGTTLCLKMDLPAGLKEKLTGIMLAMDKNPEGREVLKSIDSLRFSRAARADFDIVRQMAREAGIARPER